MLELVSVELENFRSFSNATFAPLGIGQGMTAINGSNGSGKSSVVYAIIWSLYGVTPDGVPVRALRKQGSEGEVKAKVTFRHEGQTIVVTRALRGRNDSTIASITVDGREETTVSTRAATSWVTERLGLDSEAFLTAFVVQQKELDSLIKARPAERRKVIERLAGIERMSAALETARSNAKNSQKMLDAIPVSEDPELVRGQYAESVEKLEKLGSALIVCEENETASESKVSKAKEVMTKAQKAKSALETAHHKLALVEQKKQTLEKNVNRLVEESRGHENLETVRNAADLARHNYFEADQIIKNVKAIVSQANSDQGRVEQAETDLVSAEADVARYTSQEKQFDQILENYPLDLDEKIEALSEEIKTLTQDKGALRGEYDRIQKAIETLKSSPSDQANCPTCLQKLDEVSNLIASLDSTRLEVKKKGEAMNARIAELEEESKLLVASKNKKVDIANQKANAKRALLTASLAFEKATEAVKKLKDIAAFSREEAVKAESEASEASKNLAALREAETIAQQSLRDCESAVSAFNALEEAKAELTGIVSSFGESQAEYDIASEDLLSYDFEEIENDINDAVAELRTVNENNASVRAAYPLAVNMVEMYKNNLKTIEESVEKRRVAMSDWERDSRLASTLDEFRRDRLARLAPEISEVASDLVAKMTEGKYTTLELDEDFTPILTESNGTQRPSAWLSGGEESAVALALRVAIGEILAGQRGGLLILDEVLTAQDTFRRQATMDALRALPRQIITINHVSEATDMVDLVSNVIPDGEGSSIIVDSAPSEFIGNEISDKVLEND